MALFVFLLAAALGGMAVVLLRERPRAAALVGLVATWLCLVAATVMAENTSLAIGSTTLVAGPYVRLVLVTGALALLVSQVVGLAHGWQRDLPLATLGALGLVGLALTVETPAAAMLLVAAAGSFVVIASLERAISMPAVRAVASGLRLAAIAGFMGLVAIAITGRDPIFVAPDVLAGATLLMAAAVAIRIGAIPAHAPVARLIERARTAALPLIAAWVPAAFAIVALGWTSSLVAVGETSPVSLAVTVVGVLTIALASAVVLVDDDLIRLLGYGVIADGGFVLLALAAGDAPAIAAGFAWLVCFALARSLMAGVLLGFQGAFDARRTRELGGWLRRTPLLGVALAASLMVGIGVPGTLAWDVRLTLAQDALGETLGLALVLLALVPLLAMARLAWAGVQPLDPLVEAGRSERFVVPPRPVEDTEAAASPAVPTDAEPLTTGPTDVEPVAAGPLAGEATTAVPVETELTTVEPVGQELAGVGSAAAEPAQHETTAARPVGVEAPTAGPVGADATAEPVGADAATAAAVDRAAAAVVPEGVEPAAPKAGLPDSAVTATPGVTGATSAGGSALAERGRATRAARARRQPTMSAPVPDASPAASDGATTGPSSGDATSAPQTGTTTEASSELTETATVPEQQPPAVDSTEHVAGRAQVDPAWVRLRRAVESAAARNGPIRAALRDLPAVWALDRTLIASLALLLLAAVALAVAFDLVGLGAAADLAAGVPPAP